MDRWRLQGSIVKRNELPMLELLGSWEPLDSFRIALLRATIESLSCLLNGD